MRPTAEQLEKELDRSRQRVEDLRNVGKMIRGEAGAREAAEALNKRVEELLADRVRLEARVSELESTNLEVSAQAVEAGDATAAEVTQAVKSVLADFAILKDQAVKQVAGTPAGKRSGLSVETRTWAHPFVGVALEQISTRILGEIDEAK